MQIHFPFSIPETSNLICSLLHHHPPKKNPKPNLNPNTTPKKTACHHQGKKNLIQLMNSYPSRFFRLEYNSYVQRKIAQVHKMGLFQEFWHV